MQLFYAPDLVPPHHTLSEEESRHCVRVLRLAAGDTLHLTDGRGTLYRCAVEEADVRRCTVRVEERFDEWERRPYRLTLAVAPTKNADRYEWFLEKATEVGVDRVVPIETARSERRIFRPARAEKVLAAAMKQSLKAYMPRLDPLTPFERLVAEPFAGRRMIAHCDTPRSGAGKRYLAATLRPGEEAMVLIGPEGDFSPEEIDRAVAAGFEEVTLGDQRLRTETAAVAAAVMAAVANAPSGPDGR
ncbi:16S rRNA (uracil(1498)-N(3))-methyltransferase [uncultured Alistipes sp.]|uniref:16S rRNA (uracil(1498)-N(3))-methyltransferase n=1 Tax=uncultured Alistipes sp. TaxID=538949 RepID=UPI00262BB968|nr:16S rRNA (uracil(1498)-N(3))-methyltransferase [uncultured Alistipes sp.]